MERRDFLRKLFGATALAGAWGAGGSLMRHALINAPETESSDNVEHSDNFSHAEDEEKRYSTKYPDADEFAQKWNLLPEDSERLLDRIKQDDISYTALSLAGGSLVRSAMYEASPSFEGVARAYC